MIAGVISVPERRDSVEELRALVEPSVDRLTVFEDGEHKGLWWNTVRMYDALLKNAPAGCPVLFMTDDATTVPDWRDRWERIHAAAQSKRYTLFGRQPHLFKPANLARGFVTGCFARSFYDQAAIFIDQPDFMDRMLAWFNAGGKRHPRVVNRVKYIDVVIQEFMIQHGLEWTVTTPSLFDHKPLKSTMGNNVGRSPCYVGNL